MPAIPRQLPPIQRLFDLQNFLHEFHFIERVVDIPGQPNRRETDTEHTYTLAMTAWFLAQYFDDISGDKVIRYALVHDLVEIYAGDTYAFADQEQLDTKHEREQKAFAKIKAAWQDFPEMVTAIESYEARVDRESKFVYALDKIMPPLIIFMDEGRTWKRQQVTFKLHHDKKSEQVSVSPEVSDYYAELVELMKQNPDYFHGEKR